jgi:spore coat protein U-like protein
MKLFKTIAVLACFVGLVSLGAFAGTTGTLTVQTNVATTCNVGTGAATLTFPNYDVVANATADDTGSGTFTLQCTNGEQPTISLSDGLVGTTDATRVMGGTATPLHYQLYSDLSNTVWTATPGYKLPTPMTGAVQTITVYGTIPAGQNPLQGAYSDTVTITVNL